MSGEAHRGLEACKWVAFVLMLGDHANTFLLHDRFPVLYLLGRLVFPMFALCLGFGLKGRGALVLDGTIRRLLIWACIAQMPWSMFQHGASLNVIFSLAFGAMVYQAVFVRGIGALRNLLAAAAVLGSCASEFGFAGLVVVFGALWLAESRSRSSGITFSAGLCLLFAVNGTWFALLAPAVFWAIYSYAEVPRLRHAFYGLYAAQFVLLGFLRWWL